MSVIANIITPLVGQTHTLSVTDVSNWQEVIDFMNTSTYSMSVQYNGVTYEGVISKTLDEVNLLLVFDDVLITIPSGACMLIECIGEEPEVEDTHTHCNDNLINPITDTTKIMIADDDGCPIGFVNVSDLVAYIQTSLDIPTTLCELLDVAGIPEGNLLAPDRILTTSGGCTLKSVPQSDLACS